MARKMKDSGIEWIGEIPEGWEITKIKHIVSNVTDIDHFMPDSVEVGIPYLMIGDLKDLSSSIDWDSTKMISIEDYEKLSVKSHPQKGDVIFARYASIGTTCYIDTDRDFLVSYACLTIRPSDLVIGKFLCYYLKSSSFAEDVLRRTNSNTQGNVGKDSLVNAAIVLPSIIEQTQIVNFLDAKCSDVDTILSQTHSGIEEYKKLKQAVITQAVTKGVRGEREMKNSGVEWIGEIPLTHSIYKLKYLLRTPLKYGANESGVPYSDNLPRYIRITDITPDGNLKDTGKLSLSKESAKDYILEDSDILFARSGATVGKSFIYHQSYGRSAYAGYLIKASLNDKVFPKFVYYYTCSSLYETWKNSIFIQSTIQNIGADRYANLPVPVPDTLQEQKEIADYLDAKCSEIDKLIAKKEHLVKELEAYKKSLIYEVVTGKREV